GYLVRLLQKHSVCACDGDRLTLQCPRHSTISIQSAFYGRRVPRSQLCRGQRPEEMETGTLNCMATTTLQKLLDECQDYRSCQFPVNSHVFGLDPCPGINKYLLVSYKCKPTEHKTKVVCEGKELKLHCKESRLVNIYSATYGSSVHTGKMCSSATSRVPHFDCFSYVAPDTFSKCYRKQSCKIMVTNHQFGNPCLPGVGKYLNVTYTCVPKTLLKVVDADSHDLIPPPKQKDSGSGTTLEPKRSRLPEQDGLIVSNSLAAYAYINGHPERAGLLFISSVCIGLVLTLCILVIRVSCRADFQRLHEKKGHHVWDSDDEDADSDSDGKDDEPSDSDFCSEITGFYRTSQSVYDNAEAAELAERLEHREQIIQEIWMNGGLDMSTIRTFNQ
uniref:Protein eva-1 homolog C n=2 Tax=Latimeria chalumnae TaxID=7897 RepID=H3BBF9_LATCH